MKEISKMTKIIKIKDSTKRLVNPETLTKALRAENIGGEVDTTRGPISLFYLRQILVNKLRSSGGRPRLTGTQGKRSKISFFAGDLEELNRIAEYYRETEEIRVTSSQIAAAIIHAEISKHMKSNVA